MRGIPDDAFIGWKRNDGVTEVFLDSKALPLYDHRTKGRGTPKFLGGFLDLVFNSVRWVPHTLVEVDEFDMSTRAVVSEFDNPDDVQRQADAVAAIRQLTLMFSKEFRLAPDSKVDAAIKQYVATDKELDNPLADARADILFNEDRLGRIRRVVNLCFGDALSHVDGEIYRHELTPKHGSGATADSLRGNQKWELPVWHARLERLFPYGEYALPNWRFAWKLDQIEFLEPEDEPPVKVVAVPKTQKTPRLIAEEPTCMQYVQQAIMRSLVPALERFERSKHFVGFSEQWPNQAMAQIGSDDGSLATLDLSEASDRVPNWLVEDLFADYPWFLEGIEACRSTRSKLPSGEVIPLQKFASMGSALTFPIEAMVFAAVSIERVLAAEGRPISWASIRRFQDTVRVYGDDIIVPTHTAVSVIDGLETLGFKVNRDKSFWTGEFRESCGKEFFKGLDVSIVKFRQELPASRDCVKEILATVSTRNQLYMAGLWQTAALLDSVLVKVLSGRYPIVEESSPLLGRVSVAFDYTVDALDPDTHSPLAKGWVESSRSPVNELHEESALLKCLVESIGMPNVDREHLTRSGRPRAVSIKRAMASPF